MGRDPILDFPLRHGDGETSSYRWWRDNYAGINDAIGAWYEGVRDRPIGDRQRAHATWRMLREDQRFGDTLREVLEATWPTVAPPPPDQGPRIVGRLVVDRSGQWPILRDEKGPVILRFCSYFLALRDCRTDFDRFRRTLDAIGPRWQGARIFCGVGGATRWGADGQGWRGLEIAPVAFTNDRGESIGVWRDFDDVVHRALTEFTARGLGVFLTGGDYQYLFPGGEGETAHTRRMGRLTKPHGDTVRFYETANERWQNAHDGHSTERAAALLKAFAEENPQPLGLLSSHPPPFEELAALREWSKPPAALVTKHGTRQPFEKAVRRSFNIGYERVQTGQLAQAVIDGEPTGPGEDVYLPTENRHELFGIYVMNAIRGGSVMLTGGGIRGKQPIDEGWGFNELPPLLDLIPRDVVRWRLVAGHNSDAPVYAEQFADSGAGPHRVDGATDGTRVASVVYGGTGQWRIRSRWSMKYRVVSAAGPGSERTVSEGGQLADLTDASQVARLVIGERV